MNFKDNLKISISGLKAHKSRSVLTILGIVIGITAIISVMSLGEGAQSVIGNYIEGMGTDFIVIRPGREPKGPADMVELIFGDSLTTRDVEAIKQTSNVPGLKDIAPAVIVPGSVAYRGETIRPMIFGWSAEMMADMFDIYPAKGILFNENDIRRKSAVAIIGSKVKKELFGESDAIGENIKIKDKNFRVVGVFGSRGQVPFFDVDNVVLLPYSTAQSYLLGINYYHEIIARAKSPEIIDRTVYDIKLTLREMHNITDPSKDDFFVVTPEGAIEQVGLIMNTLTIFLFFVVAISLVVGGIGIMNIMLVSVTERTHEIGLRKAVGATNKNILAQFLLEAVLLTTIGGAIGILLGAGISFIASLVLSKYLALQWSFILPVSAVLLGFGMAAFVGLVFGLYPAKQAAEKNPIEALRYE